MKLVDDQGELRILGGWKPNDPKADDRTQEGRIIIADADGSNSESYSLRRRNWGLPVVEIDGTWWCKYNLRGSVKSSKTRFRFRPILLRTVNWPIT